MTCKCYPVRILSEKTAVHVSLPYLKKDIMAHLLVICNSHDNEVGAVFGDNVQFTHSFVFSTTIEDGNKLASELFS
jgi:hypothetical protein